MKIDITSEEANELMKILEKQIEKTNWVVNNKSPENESFLQKRIDVMEDVINQIKQGLGMHIADDDTLEIDEI